MTETKLRRLLHALERQGGLKILWLEAAPGSTPGVPDCFVLNTGKGGVWLELKVGYMAEGGKLSYHIRPRQQAVRERLLKYHLNSLLLVANMKGDNIWLARDKLNYIDTSPANLLKHLRAVAYGELLNVVSLSRVSAE